MRIKRKTRTLRRKFYRLKVPSRQNSQKASAFFQGPDKPLPPVPGGGMGGTTPPPPPVPGGHMRTGSMNDLDRKNAIEVMELSDIHHPSCKLSQSRQGSFDDDADDGEFFSKTQ